MFSARFHNEQVAKTITNDMALPISYRMGTKYRYRVLHGEVAKEVDNLIRTEQQGLF